MDSPRKSLTLVVEANRMKFSRRKRATFVFIVVVISLCQVVLAEKKIVFATDLAQEAC